MKTEILEKCARLRTLRKERDQWRGWMVEVLDAYEQRAIERIAPGSAAAAFGKMVDQWRERAERMEQVCKATGYTHPDEAQECIEDMRRTIDRIVAHVWPGADYSCDPVPFDRLVEAVEGMDYGVDHWRERAERAEAQCDKLRKTVEMFAKRTDGIGMIARETLDEID